MSVIPKISGKPRSQRGSAACRRLRASGAIPCNVYGHKQEPASIAVDGEAVEGLLRSGAKVIDLDLEGKLEKALVKDVQWNTFSSHVLHVDFLRVDPDERVQVDVPITLKGTAPGVTAGGVLEIPHHTIEVECLAVDVPDHIFVKISSLQIGGMIHVSELTELPVGVKVLTPPETLLVHVVEAKAIPEPTAAEPGAEEATEPAVEGEAGEGEGGKE